MPNNPKQQGTNGSNTTLGQNKKVSDLENSNSYANGNHEKQTSLRDLFEKELKSMYSAEKQLLKALPEIARAAYNEDLQEVILDHLEETKKHSERLEKLFIRLRINEKEEEKNEVMATLIEGVNKIIGEIEEGPVRDAALIVCTQKIEHIEIAVYGSLCEFAELLGYHKIADLLDRSLEDEKNADETLSHLAQEINEEALQLKEEVY